MGQLGQHLTQGGHRGGRRGRPGADRGFRVHGCHGPSSARDPVRDTSRSCVAAVKPVPRTPDHQAGIPSGCDAQGRHRKGTRGTEMAVVMYGRITDNPIPRSTP
ncbi:hypothetical protein ACFFX0_16160 [Citricoccus parietis]|uniref:Uncharacterized protein n=1 Tax=Citricoccus parietis TaxID=592307 RepID=A0ABV5G168_9MICC